MYSPTSGYATNENVIQALGLRMNTPHIAAYVKDTQMGKATRNIPTIFFVDEESHFSAQSATRNAKSAAKGKCLVCKFTSGDYAELRAQLANSLINVGDAVRIIITDTLSSTSGRIFNIKSLCEIAEEFDCLLYLDEAHAVGAIGCQGRGVASTFEGISKYRERLIIMGTLTKTFCQFGGYVTLSDKFLSWFLKVCSPQYLFSAPIPPWMAETLVQMIALITGEFGEREREKLKKISGYMRKKLLAHEFDILGSDSQIIPIAIRNDDKAAKVKEYLIQKGYLCSFFGYPAVKKGESIVRFSLCSDISEEEIDGVVKNMILARERFRF